MLQSLIRTNRAISSILIYPQHPICAIATSEIISVLGPFCTPIIYKKILTLTVAILYCPNLANYILTKHYEQSKIYNQGEICCLLLFILIMGIKTIY